VGIVKVKHSHYRPMGPSGFWEIKASSSVTSALESGRLSALRTGRLYTQEYPDTYFKILNRPRHMELSDSTSKIPSDTTADRFWDLPTTDY
jgi:hypothetical protein